MTVLKARSRMISIRLSEDEYSALMNLRTASGARSVSDLARDAMRMLVGATESESIPQGFVEVLQAQIRTLSRQMEELNQRVMGNQRQDPTQGASPGSN